MQTINGQKTLWLVAMLIILSAVLTGLGAYFSTLNVSTLPTIIQPFFDKLKYFFGLAPALFIIAVIRGITGYLIEFSHEEYKESYEFNKLYETIGYYIGIVGSLITACTMMSEPYGSILSAIGTFVLVILNLANQGLKQIIK